MPHIAVIGAGITGVTTAYVLQDRGYHVTVFDRHRYPAMETSFANGGQLSASNAEVWNKPATVLHGLRWMLRRDAPLLVNPRPSRHKAAWMAAFVRHIGSYEANTIATAKLAIAARRHLFAMAAREDIAFDLERRGILHVYADKRAFESAVRVNRLLVAAGLDRHAVSPEEMRSIEPSLDGRHYAGLYTPSDATGDIHKFTRGLAQACGRRGVAFRFDATIEAVRARAEGGFDVAWHAPGDVARRAADERTAVDGVVVCAGTASRDIARSLGDRVNVYPVKGYSITVHLDTPDSASAAPTVSILDDAAKIVTSRLGRDRFRVAGTAEFNGYNRDIRHDRIEPLVRWTRAHFPSIATDRIVAWSGLRPMMPDMMPRVGPGRRPGIVYNTGHGHLGWTLSAATAHLAADAVEAAVPRERCGLAA